MKRVMGTILLLFLVTQLTSAQKIDFKGHNFIIKESDKGYLNYYVLDKDGKETTILESGALVNSRIFIKDADRRFYLRDIGTYRHEVTPNSLIITWSTKTLLLTERYTYSGSALNYQIDIKNKTNRKRNVGVYLIQNTYLGEEDKNHFLLDDYTNIQRERGYEYSEIPLSVKSLDSNGFGIEYRFGDDNTIRPDRVILANWEKLARSKKWPYRPKNGGLFSYGYYSINDSAIGIVYHGRNIEASSSVNYSFNLLFLSDREIELINEDQTIETDSKEVLEPITEVEEPKVHGITEEVPITVDIKSDNKDLKPIDPEREELLRMLEYVQKRQKGEDVSNYNFDENYIIEKLKEKNEQETKGN